MKIQSCTAKFLKYPALATLATLAAVAGAAMASEQAAQKSAPPAENQGTTAPSPKQVPQPYAGIVAPDTREAEPEEEEPEILDGDIAYCPTEEGGDAALPESPDEDVPVPQYFLGEIAPDAIEEVPQK